MLWGGGDHATIGNISDICIYLDWMKIKSIALEISFENLQIVPSLRGGASSGRGVQGVWRAALRSSATRPRDVTATRRRERSLDEHTES